MPSTVRGYIALGMLVATSTGEASTASNASSDLEATVELLLATHPRPYRYVDEEALRDAVRVEAERLDALPQASDVDLGLSLHRVLALVGDSHIAIGLPSFQPTERVERFLPLLPKSVGGRVFVDASEPRLARGTELLAIEGQPIAQLMRELEALALVDGRRSELPRARVERYFTQHFHLWVPPRDEYEVRVRAPSGPVTSVRFAGQPREVIRSLRAKRISLPVWGHQVAEEPPLPALVPINETTSLAGC